MPAYDYYCNTCEKTFEYVSAVAERTSASCPTCGATVPGIERLWTPPLGDNIFVAYFDNGLNTTVRSWAHRKQIMKERGLEEIGNDRTFMDNQKELLASCRDKQNSRM